MDNESIQKPKSQKENKKVEALTIEEQKKLTELLWSAQDTKTAYQK